MAFDFDGFKEYIHDNIGDDEEYSLFEEKEAAGFQKIRSLPEEEINTIYEALHDAIGDEWTKMADEFITEGISFDMIKDELFTEKYFEKYPDEKKRWGEHEDYDNDLFIDFIKKHDYIDYIRQVAEEQMPEIDSHNTQFAGCMDIHENSYEDHARGNALEKVSKETGLPFMILYYFLDYYEP